MSDTKPRAVILMGVAGSGKSTVGANLAKRLAWAFLDADDFHPAANVEKMSNGIPLNDEDLLFTSGRLDSLDAVEIIMSIEGGLRDQFFRNQLRLDAA